MQRQHAVAPAAALVAFLGASVALVGQGYNEVAIAGLVVLTVVSAAVVPDAS